MSFINPIFIIIGLAGIAVPILIHLLTRDQIKKVAFSTLRFFARNSQAVLRKKNFSELILIILRVLACVLLAIAFARPFFKAKPEKDIADGSLKVSSAQIVLVDTSASMSQSISDADLQALARSAESGAEAVALIAFDKGNSLLCPITTDRNKFDQAVNNIHIGHGGTNLAAALRMADETLRNIRTNSKKIILISDLQRSGWEKYRGGRKLGAGVELEIKSVVPETRKDNLAIVGASTPDRVIKDQNPRNIAIRVANFSKKDVKDIPVVFKQGNKEIGRQQLFIPAGATVASSFRHVFDATDNNPCTVTILAEDAAKNDNIYYFNSRVIPKISVLLVSSSGLKADPDMKFFLELALSPSPESPFAVTSRDVSKLTPSDISSASVVILADVGEVSPAILTALTDFLKRGGGILFMPGNTVDPDKFKKSFASILPCNLRRVITKTAKDGKNREAALSKVDYTHPVFDVFLRPHYGDFSNLRFKQYWEVTGSQMSRVLARYDDGRPAIIEKQRLEGISMMWLSPVSKRWSNLPSRAIYLPMLHQCIRYLALRKESKTGYQVGDLLPQPAAGVKLKNPKGDEMKVAETKATIPGFYTLTDKTPFIYAVNTPLDEADSTPIIADELIASLKSIEKAQKSKNASWIGLNSQEKKDKNIWWYALIAVIILMLAELHVANRTTRH